MPKKLFLLLVLLLTLSSVQAQTKDDREQLRYLKTVEWPKAYREQDTMLLNRLLADEFQLIEASGEVSTKRAEMEYIKKHKPSYTSFVYTIQRLDVFENGTAIVSGMGTIQGRDKDGAYETTYASSNVLIKRKGQWQAVASHVSGVKRNPKK
jgi:ketosteroid isomerase-like protein